MDRFKFGTHLSSFGGKTFANNGTDEINKKDGMTGYGGEGVHTLFMNKCDVSITECTSTSSLKGAIMVLL